MCTFSMHLTIFKYEIVITKMRQQILGRVPHALILNSDVCMHVGGLGIRSLASGGWIQYYSCNPYSGTFGMQ